MKRNSISQTVPTVMPRFPKFVELGNDLIAHVLSFVADVPFETTASSSTSTLTHVLPLVSKEFRRISGSDFFWKLALERLVVKDPYLWEKGLLSFLPPGITPSSTLVQQVGTHLALEQNTYRSIFQRLTRDYLRFTAPLFHMLGQVQLGHSFGLHFFEPRYRHLIATVMRGYESQGEPLEEEEGPTFLYAHTSPLAPMAVACVVQVQRCHIYPDGSADVTLVPIHYVWLEKIREIPQTGRLYEGQSLRMSHGHSLLIEEQDDEDTMMHFMDQHRGQPSEGVMQAILSYLRTGNAEALMQHQQDDEPDEANETDN